jgi:putative transposase
MTYPLVRELAGDGIPVTVTCRVLKIARQPYYRGLACPVSDAELDEAYVANAVFDAHRDDPEFGYRFLADEVRQAGHQVCDRTVWRICRDNGWWSVFGRPRSRRKTKAGTPAHDDLVRRDFTAGAPNRLWLADITEHPTGEGKLYLCAIKDVFSNRIVGWSIDHRMKAHLVVAALDNAVARRDEVAGCILHSDRGSQGELKRSSQHLDRGGVCGWRRCGSASGRFSCIGGRSRRRVGRRWRGVRTASGSGLRSLVG